MSRKLGNRLNLALVLVEWSLIVLSMWVGTHTASVGVMLLCIAVIGARMHALGVLMHEAAHGRLSGQKKWNDRFARLFLAWPALINFEAFRKSHLLHHRHMLTDQDPTAVRKVGNPLFVFPLRSPSQVVSRSLFLLLGGGVWVSLRDWKRVAGKSSREPNAVESWGRLAFLTVAILATSYFRLWPTILLFWFVPLFTVFTLINYWRTVAEHFSIPGRLEQKRNLILNPITAFWIAPYGVGYHGIHHERPGLHWLELTRASLPDSDRNNQGLRSFLEDCVRA